jgi:hypothetical protein
MEDFRHFEPQQIGELSPGVCVAVSVDGGACVGVISPPMRPAGPIVIAPFWSSLATLPPARDIDSLSNSEVLVLSDAKAVPSRDSTHLHFGLSEKSEPLFGALILAGGDLYAVARHGGAGFFFIKLKDGSRSAKLDHIIWFSSWAIVSPDVEGRWRTICSMECKT